MRPRALIVTDLGYGDSGKGSITDFLVREIEATLVVRYNGGAQAAHRVVRPNGNAHVFSQWGSGTFHGAQTLLAKPVVIHPFALAREAEALEIHGISRPLDLLMIEDGCSVVTPFQQSINRLREYARGKDRHGSCGVGIGETVQDRFQEYTICAGDLHKPDLLLRKLHLTKDVKIAVGESLDLPSEGQNELAAMKALNPVEIRDRMCSIAERLKIVTKFFVRSRMQKAKRIVFEGAQGVLLDMTWGFHPYSTWSNCTDEHARKMLEEFDGKIERVGVVRAYTTRHGPGPFVPYDEELTRRLPDEANEFHPFQREFRCGWLDVPALKYAIAVNKGVDYLAVTCLDRTAGLPEWGWCSGYRHSDGRKFELVAPEPYPSTSYMTEIGAELLKCTPEVVKYERPPSSTITETVENMLGVEVGLTSLGPTCNDKRWEL